MDSIILIFVCMLAGVGLQKVKAFPPNAYVALNQFVIHISLPALALYYIPKIAVGIKLLYPLGIAWIGFLLAFIFFVVLAKIFGWSRKLTGCLILTAGLGNTSFVGFPVIEALYGKEGLETAIIVDQPGSFVVMATLGIIVAASYSRSATGTAAMVKKILLFPPFIAFFIGMTMNLLKYDFINDVQSVLSRLGSTVTPVALIAVGMQLKIDRKSKHWGFLGLGLFFKLMITPAFFYILYKLILKGEGIETDVSVMEAAMAPMITATILASSHGLKPRLSGMMIGVGIPLSFITLAFWYWILSL
ncbi:MAG: transporter [Flavobacterium sp. MedPE-SWcel]|uniref:AEC family transporter n=1 Tax=uncultured Flavobacterium sp. TaxID=165435 RepID=UPI00091308E0|nr:AEC family transporter [uncultured Flavobacterium sp.]OIQ16225.1 MAG: transporter [Flavobacterium sp. MedPE-SWcel]